MTATVVDNYLSSAVSRPSRLWLAQTLEAIDAVQLRDGGNYRYPWATGDRVRRRGRVIATAALPYPKQVDT